MSIDLFEHNKTAYEAAAAMLAEISTDITALDEYHRGGAHQWNKTLSKFLKINSDVPIWGLSAANVRYLDNQRDMEEELFDGNIASEMTLGEAIVRGILKAPLYISTVFSYQKELEKYMPDKRGKYVVFCANREHLDEMISHVDEWFSKIDNNPKVYKVYSEELLWTNLKLSVLLRTALSFLTSLTIRLRQAGTQCTPASILPSMVILKRPDGTAKPSAAYRAEDGYILGRWLSKQKKSFINGELNKNQIEKLTQIGVEL